MRRRVCLLLPAFLWATPALYPAGKYPGTRVTLAAGWISEWLPKWGSQAASLLPRPSTVSSLKTSDILPGTEVEKRCQQLIHQSSARFFCVYYPTRAQPDALAPLLGCPAACRGEREPVAAPPGFIRRPAISRPGSDWAACRACGGNPETRAPRSLRPSTAGR